MRSKLALVIAIGALLPLISSFAAFFETVEGNYQYGMTAIRGGAWLSIGPALAGPLSLFAFAAVVEMLFRISGRLPISPSMEVPRSLGLSQWRSTLAKIFLGMAAVSYVLSAVAVWRYLSARSVLDEMPSELPGEFVFSLVFTWLTGPLTLIAWAAVIEYLSRIAAALHRPGYTP